MFDTGKCGVSEIFFGKVKKKSTDIKKNVKKYSTCKEPATGLTRLLEGI